MTISFSPVPLWPGNGIPAANVANSQVFLDPLSDEIVIRPDLETPPAAALRFELHSRAAVTVSVKISRNSAGSYVYTYTLSALSSSRRPLQQFALLLPVETSRGVTPGRVAP